VAGPCDDASVATSKADIGDGPCDDSAAMATSTADVVGSCDDGAAIAASKADVGDGPCEDGAAMATSKADVVGLCDDGAATAASKADVVGAAPDVVLLAALELELMKSVLPDMQGQTEKFSTWAEEFRLGSIPSLQALRLLLVCSFALWVAFWSWYFPVFHFLPGISNIIFL